MVLGTIAAGGVIFVCSTLSNIKGLCLFALFAIYVCQFWSSVGEKEMLAIGKLWDRVLFCFVYLLLMGESMILCFIDFFFLKNT